MRVKMMTSMAGPRVSYRRGETVELDDAEAKRLIERELAVPVREEQDVEEAVDQAPEQAVKRGPGRPRKG